ncbi:hypothetical protein BXZ70DRAFT_894266, partial [Cristinia sonorae]
VPNYYEVLAVSPTASFTDIKLAYHRALLLFHPDKQRQQSATSDAVDIGLIKQAFITLSASASRAEYDATLAKRPSLSGPRPAQAISLEEFEEVGRDGEEAWTYGCRCGGRYYITEQDMEQGQHIVGCSSCSEVVWVGYELLAEDGNDHFPEL